jgi:hypothetical protein
LPCTPIRFTIHIGGHIARRSAGVVFEHGRSASLHGNHDTAHARLDDACMLQNRLAMTEYM